MLDTRMCLGIIVSIATHLVVASSTAPSHLQVNYQRAPALGVGPFLRLSWAVPPGQHMVQTSYQILIRHPDSRKGAKTVFDSGVVRSSKSVNIAYDARAIGLRPGSYYEWTVTCNGGDPSQPAAFVTALWDGFGSGAQWIWSSDLNNSHHFARFRYVLPPFKTEISRALLFVTGWVEPTMLSAYKFYIDGELVSLGPGRGEADVMNANSTFRHAPYATADVTSWLHSESVLAVEGMAPLFKTPCLLHACKDPNDAGGGVLAQLTLSFADGTSSTIVTETKTGDWQALGADDYYQPASLSTSVLGHPEFGSTAYAKVLEQVDARKEVLLWKTASAMSPRWPSAVASAYQAFDQLLPKSARPLVVYKIPKPLTRPMYHDETHVGRHSSSFLIDFGRNFQGGVELSVEDGTAGTVVQIVSGELLLPNGTVDSKTRMRLDPGNTWGYAFNWTLRDGPQTLRQYQYMLFRYLAVTFVAGPIPANFSFGAWGVKYEYQDSDSAFVSDNSTLNAVYELSRWTLDGGVIDTYTDSNTRERRPYECDGLIASANRQLLQSDAMWARHSHSWVLEVPTWPIEWQQMSALLAYHDFMETGAPDLFRTYENRLYNRTNIDAVDSTGLVNTSKGRHIVAWDPPPGRDMFVGNSHTSVCNGWAVRGLEALATMARAAGSARNAIAYAQQATNIQKAMARTMWNASFSRYCDGPCNDPKVNGHGGITTNYFTLYFGLVPESAVSSVWQQVVDFGLEKIGDYSAFVMLEALARYPNDDGSALVRALTKCDASSWCNEIRVYNATMTTESLGVPHATMSHPWGTAPISAVVHGIMGVRATAPAWSNFTVAPLLGPLTFANATIPTIRGPIIVAAEHGSVSVVIPCNTWARLCVAVDHNTSSPKYLELDGIRVVSHREAQHVCVATPVGCALQARVLRSVS